ncbi:unnamed protein product, partial [Staurois parvus]
SVPGTTSDQQTAAAPRALSSGRLPGTRSHGQCAGSLSRQLPGHSAADSFQGHTQPRTVCRVPPQQHPGHSAADRFQGHAATDNAQGPSAAALRALSREGSCRAVETPNLGVLQRATVLTFWASAECAAGMAGRLGPPHPSLPASFREQDDSSS